MQQSINSSIPGRYKVGFHEDPLVLSWLLLANVTLLVGAVKWHKYSFYLHAILGLVIIGLTLAGTLHVLFQVGIYYKQTKKFQLIHNIGGLIVVIWLSIQLVTGIISRLILSSSTTSPNVCRWTKLIHQYSSYLLMILSKFQYLIIYYRRNKWSEIVMYLCIDVVFIWLYLWLKFKYKKLEESVKDGQMIKYSNEVEDENGILMKIWVEIKKTIRQIKYQYYIKQLEIPSTKYLAVVYHSQKQIPIPQYILFNDYVYDISSLNQIHPGGQKLLQQVRNKQVDRFLYGFYPSQTTQSFSIHKHTKDSLRICGPPIARIQRKCPLEGFNEELILVKMQHCRQIHKNSKLFSIQLHPISLSSQNWTHFRFNGYTNQSQLGQYFTLTISNKNGTHKLTRLYTSIWCMRMKNIQFMKINYQNLFERMNSYSCDCDDVGDIIESSSQSSTTTNNHMMKIQGEEGVMLIIKKYDKGKFTSRLLGKDGGWRDRLILSKPMGSGLRYQQLRQKGMVVIICGGTGILPFCDLIDLLFKRIKYIQHPNNSLAHNDPIITTDIIQNRSFSIYYACDNIQDCPTLTSIQLNYLSQSKFIKFNTIFRVKYTDIEKTKRYPNIKFQMQYFMSQIEELCKEKHRINHIYVCGPHRMNFSIRQVLVNNQVDQQAWTFV